MMFIKKIICYVYTSMPLLIEEGATILRVRTINNSDYKRYVL